MAFTFEINGQPLVPLRPVGVDNEQVSVGPVFAHHGERPRERGAVGALDRQNARERSGSLGGQVRIPGNVDAPRRELHGGRRGFGIDGGGRISREDHCTAGLLEPTQQVEGRRTNRQHGGHKDTAVLRLPREERRLPVALFDRTETR